MSRQPWDGEAPDVIGDAAPSDEVGARVDEHPRPEARPRMWRRASYGLAVATAVFIIAELARVAVGLWMASQVTFPSGGAPHLSRWQYPVLIAGANAGDIQLLPVVTVLAASAMVGATWLNGRSASEAWPTSGEGWRPAAILSMCAATGAGVVLAFYLLVLVSALELLRSAESLGQASAGFASLPAIAGQAALIALGCATAGATLARYALARTASPQRSHPS